MKKYCIGIASAFFALLIAMYPTIALSSAKSACVICAQTLIPSLLPFLICSSFLTASGVLNKISLIASPLMKPVFSLCGACCAPLIMGLFGGYPLGALSSANLYLSGGASKNEAERLAAFSNNCAPVFILGTLGAGIFNNQAFGVCLLISNTLSSLITGVVLGFLGSPSTCRCNLKTSKSLTNALPDAVFSVLNLCGFVIFFSVCTALLEKINFLNFFARFISFFGADYQNALFISKAFLEITSALSSCKNIPLPIVSCMLSLGGFSVFAQTYSFLHRAGLSCKFYIFGKVLSGGFSAAITSLIIKFII